MTIGERAYKAISDRAAEIGMEAKEYAKTIGIDPRNPSYRETGYSEHRAYLLSLMAEAGLDVHWILTGQRVDKVEVVRCEDCKKRYTPDCIMSDGLGEAGDNDFCSYGERKGDNAGA